MEGLVFAGRDGKDTLYKFRPFFSEEMKSRVREIVLDHKIYFSRGSQINDPFDLAPAFVLNRTGGELETRKRLMRDAEASLRRQGHGSEHVTEKLAIVAIRELDRFETEARERVLDRLERNYFVFSLAGNRTHPMLWSHYADGHKGVCIHFTAREPSIFAAAMKVHYHPIRPQVSIPLPVEQDLLKKATLSKGDFWLYEDEYRLVRFPESDVKLEDFGLTFETPQKARYESRWITGLTVGAYMSSADVEEMMTMAKEHHPPLPVWRAKPTLTFELTFDQIA